MALYQQAISVLYAAAYTLKMSYKTDYKTAGFFEYVVPALEGFWRQENKDAFHWISAIRLPDFVRLHMSDARKAAPEKWRTVIRHPIRRQIAKLFIPASNEPSGCLQTFD